MTTGQDYLLLYEQLGIEILRRSEREGTAKCPFHSDQTPSLAINREHGVFKCHAGSCGKAGSWEMFQELIQEVGTQLTIAPEIIEEHHRMLLSNQQMLDWCYRERGLTHETILQYKLGLESGRLWIPILDNNGRYVNVRRHAVDKETAKHGKTISYKVGYGLVRLWPLDSLRSQELWLCEGELDCLVMLQLGFSSCTTTGGAGSWKDEWGVKFEGKKVNVVYDTDKAGLDGALNVGGHLFQKAKEIKLINLAFSTAGHKDITDFFVKERRTKTELLKLESETAPFVKNELVFPEKDKTVHELELHDASKEAMVGKFVKTKIIVAGKDLSPFTVPKEVNFTCRMGLRICTNCSIAKGNGSLRATLPNDEPGLLTLLNTNEVMQKANLRKLVGIVDTCPRFKHQVLSYQNLEEIKIMPDLDYLPDVNTEYVIRQAYHVGDGIRTNQPYEAEGVVAPHPNSQYVTFLFPKMTMSKGSMDSYRPTQESQDRLKIFQPYKGNQVMEKWKDITQDLVDNITHIYKREDLVYATDLTFHSVLRFKFREQLLQRGWVEGLLVGDTRCGKTETVKALVGHYKVGEIVTGESVSYAGLVGGLQQTNKRWSITWGKIPLNDRRVLVIDEVSGMSLEDISRMSGIRSSGIAELSKIQTERTLARTRLLWVSNPRGSRPLNSYDSGAVVVRELIGKPEDIARFDYCMMVSSNEVPLDVINQRTSMKVTHRYTSDLCHELLMWTWSRTTEQVHLTEKAVTSCLDYASDFARTYSATLPLVEPNEQRIKFARMAAAVAARLYSTEDGENLLVTEDHVQVVADLLNKWYTNTNFGYRFYSEMRMKELDLNPEDEIQIKNLIYPLGLKFCQALLSYTVIRPSDLQDLTNKERKDAALLLGTLVQTGCLKRRSTGYYKTPGFIRLLRETKPSDIPGQADY